MRSRKASVVQKDTSPLGYEHAIALYRQGRYEEVIESLSHVVVRDDTLGDMVKFYRGMSHRTLGMTALQNEDYHRAERHLRSAAKDAGPSADLGRHLASIFARTGRPIHCAEQLRSVSAVDGANVEGICRLARAQFQAGQRSTARLALRRGLREFPRNSAIHCLLGLFAAGQDDYRRARRYLQRSVQFDCTNWRAWRYLGLVSLVEHDIPAGIRAFQRAFDLQPNNLELAWRLSLAAQAGRQNGYGVVLHLPETPMLETDSPIRQLASYIVREKDYLKACLNPLTAPKERRYYHMLRDVLTTALRMHPDYADIHLAAGRVAMKLGDAPHAVEHAERATEINPTYVDALVFLADRHAEAGDVEKGIARYREAISAGGDWADIHQSLSALRRQQRQMGDVGRSEQDSSLKTHPLRRAA
jgi:tetratricopeptide (TPR) repeat protein